MRERRSEAGYTLIMLMAAVTIMLITMALGVPFWQYLVKDDREQELLFRGGEIADAIARYQVRFGAPPSLEVLVEQRFLRKEYKDPITGGEFRLIRPGDALGPGGIPGGVPGAATGAGAGLAATATPAPTPPPASTRSPGGGAAQGGIEGGGVVGVASTSEESSLRLFNGQDRYDQWLFIAGQPRMIGSQQQGPLGLPGVGPTGAPGVGGSIPPASQGGAGSPGSPGQGSPPGGGLRPEPGRRR